MKTQIYFNRNINVLISFNKINKDIIYNVIESKSLSFKDLSVNQLEKLSIIFNVNLFDLIYSNLLKKELSISLINGLDNINDINQVCDFIKIKNNYLNMINLRNK